MIHLLTKNYYIPWDTDLFLKAIDQLRTVIGIAFNVGFWLFLAIIGILLVKSIIEYFVG